MHLANLLHKVHYNWTSPNASWPDNHSIWHGRDFSTSFLVEISLSDTFTTIDPVFTSMPFLWNFSSAKAVILLSNLKTNKFSSLRTRNIRMEYWQCPQMKLHILTLVGKGELESSHRLLNECRHLATWMQWIFVLIILQPCLYMV